MGHDKMSLTQETWTKSAKIDHIKTYLQNNRELEKTVYSIRLLSNPVLLFNPLQDEMITHLFATEPEAFVDYLKAAIVLLVDSYEQDKSVVRRLTQRIAVQITDATKVRLNELGPQYEGIPVSIECQVIAGNNFETYLKSATAKCYGCQKEAEVTSLADMPVCLNKDCSLHKMEMTLIQSSVKTGFTRLVMIQELIEQAKHGSPIIYSCRIRDDDVTTTFIGQRKKMIVVFRSLPIKGKTTNAILLHAISVQDLEESKGVPITDKQIELFKAMAKQKEYLKILQRSFAPEIYGENLAKLCVILGIIGGKKVGRLRGDVHVLLCGDPATGKSKLIEFMTLVVDKSAYVNGATASGSGITVAMDTLPNRQKIPRAGPMSTCTGGCLGADELNQLQPEDLGMMYEGMENGTIHYTKAGFDLMFAAETTVIGGANPKKFVYDPDLSPLDNLGLPYPLISRFDLKVNMRNIHKAVERQERRSHVMLLRRIGVEQYLKDNGLLTPADLNSLFAYAKTLNPLPSKKAEELINTFQDELESIDKNKGDIPIDMRFYESIIRISTAYARLHLADEITEEHAAAVIDIYRAALKTFGQDTSREPTQLSMDSAVKGKEDAFLTSWRKLEGIEQNDWLLEEDFLNLLVKDYPDLFNMSTAQDLFEKKYNKHLIEKKNGRYRLA